MNKVKLADIASFQTGPFGTQFSASEYVDSGIPVINVKNIGYGNILDQELDYITEATRDRLSSHVLKNNDIVFGRKGSVDRHAFIDERYDGWVQGSDCIRVRCNSSVNAHYVSHYLKLPQVKKQINSSAVGSTMASLNLDILKDIIIILPSAEEQNAVENFLSALESKMDVNTAICSELEAMAKTLYDYWFVQFDFPDENGKPYRTSGGEMVWNDQLKREIPKEWSVKPLSHGIKSINTGLNPRDNFSLGKGDIQYVTVKNLTTSGTIDFSGCDTLDEEARAMVHTRSDISIGDILFASIAPLGRCYLIQATPENWDINESVFSIRANTETVTPEFLYMYFMGDIFIKGATSSSTGSIFKGIRINTLLDMIAVFPPKSVVDKFSTEIKRLLTLKEKKVEENRELTKLRDWLLPMLMNGQATVTDVSQAKTISFTPNHQNIEVRQAARNLGNAKMDDTEDLVKEFLRRKKDDSKSKT